MTPLPSLPHSRPDITPASPSSLHCASSDGDDPLRRDSSSARRWDFAVAGAALLLFAAVAGIGDWLQRSSFVLRSPFPPLEAWWRPHAGPGTPLAVTVAILVVAYGPVVAERLPWRALLWSTWAAAMAWTWSLALVDGWRRGITGRLLGTGEYLTQLHRFDHLGPALRTYTDHIRIDSPQHWTTHIAGHPAGTVLTFVGLDRIGLGGGTWAAAFVMTTGTSLVVAVLITLGLLWGDQKARAAAPFLALAPGAVWVGVSADGYFAAVAAWSLALLAVAATRASPAPRAVAGFGGGLLLGAAIYLSYGLVLLVIPAAVVLLCVGTVRPVPYVLAGGIVVVAAFTGAGFDWWQAYGLLKTRYYQGYGGVRPYSYWFFGDLATVVAAAGLASAAGLRRVMAAVPGLARTRVRGDRRSIAAVLLPCGFLLAMLVADLTGMSKAETERIWLPFTLWLPACAAFLRARDHRVWLALQALVALLLNHLLLTGW